MWHKFQLMYSHRAKYLTLSTKVLTAPMIEELGVKTLRMVATCYLSLCSFSLPPLIEKGPQIAQGNNNQT